MMMDPDYIRNLHPLDISPDEVADHIEGQTNKIKLLIEALGDMRSLFSEDGALLKGTHLNATLQLAGIALSAAKEPTR